MKELKYKMVVSDFDGTLLRNDDTVSARTLDAIRRYTQAGGIFTVSTGRMYASIEKRLPDAGIKDTDVPVMSYQGAYVKRLISGEVLSKIPLKTKLAAEIIAEAERMGIYCQSYSFSELYVPEINSLTEAYCALNRVEPNVVGRLSDYIYNAQFEVPKVVMVITENMDFFYRHFYEKFSSRAQIIVSAPVLLEAISLDAGKGNGIAAAGAACNISCDEILAVGDEMNDLSMIERAGLGVAMGNANKALKDSADFITDTNDNDGLAKVIERFCL